MSHYLRNEGIKKRFRRGEGGRDDTYGLTSCGQGLTPRKLRSDRTRGTSPAPAQQMKILLSILLGQRFQLEREKERKEFSTHVSNLCPSFSRVLSIDIHEQENIHHRSLFCFSYLSMRRARNQIPWPSFSAFPSPA